MTQIERYARALRVEIKSVRMYVGMQIGLTGSIRAQTIRGLVPGFKTRVEIDSDESPERLAAVLRNAENGCYASQALLNPTPIDQVLVVKGQEFPLGDFPAPAGEEEAK